MSCSSCNIPRLELFKGGRSGGGRRSGGYRHGSRYGRRYGRRYGYGYWPYYYGYPYYNYWDPYYTDPVTVINVSEKDTEPEPAPTAEVIVQNPKYNIAHIILIAIIVFIIMFAFITLL